MQYRLTEANKKDLIEWLCSGKIERALRALETLNPLDQPVSEPVAWQIKFKDEHGTQRNVTYTHNAIGDYRQIDPNAICEPLYTHPAPFTPITADDVSHDVEIEFTKQFTNGAGMTNDNVIAAAVNAYMKGKQ